MRLFHVTAKGRRVAFLCRALPAGPFLDMAIAVVMGAPALLPLRRVLARSWRHFRCEFFHRRHRIHPGYEWCTRCALTCEAIADIPSWAVL